MQKPTPITLRGSHIQLEPMQECHRCQLKILSQDEKISTYSPTLKLKFDKWFDKAIQPYDKSDQLSFIVRNLTDQKIIGSTRYYEIHIDHARLSIGYTWYVPSVWGTVVNVECKLLLLRHAFDQLQTNRIEFFIDSRNERSRAAVQKLGAIQEGILRQHIILDDGYIRDTVVYSILKIEWPKISVKLKERLSNYTR